MIGPKDPESYQNGHPRSSPALDDTGNDHVRQGTLPSQGSEHKSASKGPQLRILRELSLFLNTGVLRTSGIRSAAKGRGVPHLQELKSATKPKRYKAEMPPRDAAGRWSMEVYIYAYLLEAQYSSFEIIGKRWAYECIVNIKVPPIKKRENEYKWLMSYNTPRLSDTSLTRNHVTAVYFSMLLGNHTDKAEFMKLIALTNQIIHEIQCRQA